MRHWLFAILWGVVVTVLLCIPGNNLPESDLDKIPFFDKYVHVVLFAILTCLWCQAFFNVNNQNSASRIDFKVATGVTVYGIVMEFVQKYFVVMRSFDIIDILADAVGVLIGALIFRRLVPKSS